MSVKVIEPRAKPPWELEVDATDGGPPPNGVKITISGVRGEPTCQLRVQESGQFGKAVFANLTVKDLVDAAMNAQALSGRQITTREP